MIPQTPSVTVAPDSSASLLLRLGGPFREFPRFSILQLQSLQDHDYNPIPFSEWLTKRLQDGLPFVIQDFDKLPLWNRSEFGIERLIELSTKKNIPIRNCSTGRDLSFTLRKFADAARQSYQEFQNLYARDLQCPQEWQEQCRRILPPEVQWGGRLDLFQWLPQCARSEVMMAYVGSEGSSSGFHRCFSSTVALNLLVESDERPVVCIGTDFESQKKYDSFMSARGISPHLDWLNLTTNELLRADFPLYAYDQKVGDLVVFPPATAHQVWNPSTLSTKLVWNILHPLSLEVGFQYVQPPFNRLCHPDVARTNLSLACAMLSLIREDAPVVLPPDLPLLSRLFRQMVHEESIESEPVTAITLIPLPNTEVATCNFCGTAIWNRHVRCTECTGFDLCLACYLNGRSCEHSQSYAWAELVSPDQCTRILNRAREILGFQPEDPRMPDRCKTLGTAVNDLMKAKQNSVNRLCHLCRIEHPDWKGRRCDKCIAFFCYRGLYRHFDMNSADVVRHSGLWTCPKCLESCNCRCCHFSTAYVKAEKPASKRRVKPADARGKIMGFTDNVFDQKRGQRTSTGPHGHTNSLPGVVQITGQKRPLSESDVAPMTPLRKIEFPTPEPDFNARFEMRMTSEGSDYLLDSQYIRGQSGSGQSNMLPGIKTFSDQQLFTPSSAEDHQLIGTSPTGISTLASAAASHHRLPATKNPANTLPPMLNHHHHHQTPILPRQNGPADSQGALLPSGSRQSTTCPALDDSINQLEERIATLRRYEDEFVQLNLDDSRKLLQSQIVSLEADLKRLKKDKSLSLAERLKQAGFGGLADGVRREVEGWGVGLGLKTGANGSDGNKV